MPTRRRDLRSPALPSTQASPHSLKDRQISCERRALGAHSAGWILTAAIVFGTSLDPPRLGESPVGLASHSAMVLLSEHWTFVLFAAGVMAVWQSSRLRQRANVLDAAAGPRPSAPNAPERPAGLDPPAFSPRAFTEPRRRYHAQPPTHLPGTWEYCQECGRALSDPQSRWHGVGPYCLRRTGTHYPQGPENPEFARWQAEEEVLKQQHTVEVCKLKALYKAEIRAAKARHNRSLRAWTLDLSTRERLQSIYDTSMKGWREDKAVCDRAATEWDSDPLREIARRCARRKVAIRVWAGALILLALMRFGVQV